MRGRETDDGYVAPVGKGKLQAKLAPRRARRANYKNKKTSRNFLGLPSKLTHKWQKARLRSSAADRREEKLKPLNISTSDLVCERKLYIFITQEINLPRISASNYGSILGGY